MSPTSTDRITLTGSQHTRTDPDDPGRAHRGAVAYLAAYDVHRGKVFGRCENTTGIAAFTNLVAQVMTREPYASADRVFWIVDNGSSHRGQAAIDQLAEQYPNAIMVNTPVHASWLNQIEIYFSIVQRKVLSPNDFTDTDAVSECLSAFENRYNQTAQPFKWKFTTTDLTELLTSQSWSQGLRPYRLMPLDSGPIDGPRRGC